MTKKFCFFGCIRKSVMTWLSYKEKATLVSFYALANSIVSAQRHYCITFKTNYTPKIKTIRRLAHNFLGDGTVNNLQKGRSDRKRSVRTENGIQEAGVAITDGPAKSTSKVAHEVGTSHTTVRNILQTDLKLKPYKVTTHQTLFTFNK